MSYNSKSKKAEEFICHEEIEETLRYAEEHKNDVEDMRKILERAKAGFDFLLPYYRYFSALCAEGD